MERRATLWAILALAATLAACASPQEAEEAEPIEETEQVDTEPAAEAQTDDEQVIQPPKPTADWGYGEEAGPEEWGELSPEFEMCAIGKNQSPIDIDNAVQARERSALKTIYPASPTELVHKGYSLQANYLQENRLMVAGQQFDLVQMHFHAPGEHTIRGKDFPLEAHFVHADEDGNLAVIALMIEAGEASPELAKLLQNVPAGKGEQVSLEGAEFDAQELLPPETTHYRYNGSLTTPPCTEGVRFFVLDNPVTASDEQIQKIFEAVGHENNRPIQPTNARIIVHDVD